MLQTSSQIKLSPYHEIFYNEWRLDPQRSDYNIVFDYEIHTAINPDRLRQAIKRMSQDYFLLHCGINEENGQAYWVSMPYLSVDLDYFPSPRTKEQLLAYVKLPFDLENGPLLRVALIKLADNCYRLITIFHHLIMDNAKSNFVYQTIPNYYHHPDYRFELSINEQMQRLKNLSWSLECAIYKDEYAHKSFWDTQLADLIGPDLKFLKISNKNPTFKNSPSVIEEYLFHLHDDLGQQLKQIQKKFAITPYLYSQAIFALLLHRYTDQEKFGICYMVSIHDGADFIYGAHVNPCFIPYEFSDEKNIIDILEETKNFIKNVKAGKHHHYPIQRILPKYVQNNLLAVGFSQTDLKNEYMQFEGVSQQSINTELNM